MKQFKKAVSIIALFLVCLNYSCSHELHGPGCCEETYIDVNMSIKELPASGGKLELDFVNYYNGTPNYVQILYGKSAEYIDYGVFYNFNHIGFDMTKTSEKNNYIYRNSTNKDEIIKAYIGKGKVELDFPANKIGENRTFVIFANLHHSTNFRAIIMQAAE